jgi:hypothetical protein
MHRRDLISILLVHLELGPSYMGWCLVVGARYPANLPCNAGIAMPFPFSESHGSRHGTVNAEPQSCGQIRRAIILALSCPTATMPVMDRQTLATGIKTRKVGHASGWGSRMILLYINSGRLVILHRSVGITYAGNVPIRSTVFSQGSSGVERDATQRRPIQTIVADAHRGRPDQLCAKPPKLHASQNREDKTNTSEIFFGQSGITF